MKAFWLLHRNSLFPAFVLLALPGILPAQSTIDTVARYAYAANAGWVNFRPFPADGVVVGEAYLSGYAYAANFGWIHLGDGTPNDGIHYTNASATDFGVNHDGAGNLSGYAYAANVGWINFGWAGAGDANRPRIDLISGVFDGYAYGANIGWINLGAGYLATDTIFCPDSDTDGIGDPWELMRFTTLGVADETTDSDGDGELDVDEYGADTNPLDPLDRLRIVRHDFDFSGPEVELEFTSRPTRVYCVEYKNDLNIVSWTNSSLGTFAPDAGATTTRTIKYPANDLKFFHVVAKKPLAPPPSP